MSQFVKKSLIVLSITLAVFSIAYACNNCSRPKQKKHMVISGLVNNLLCHAAPRLGMSQEFFPSDRKEIVASADGKFWVNIVEKQGDKFWI